MNASPKRKSRIDIATITGVIDDLHASHSLKVVVFSGGEPTLAKPVLRQAIRHCREKSILCRIVSNASWARTPTLATKTLKELWEDGLSEINISSDDFHLPYVPFSHVINAWNAAKGLGFKSVVIANSASRESRVTPGFIQRQIGEERIESIERRGLNQMMVFPSSDGTYYAISSTRYQRLEKAASELDEKWFNQFENQFNLAGGCSNVLSRPAISPGGHMLGCCGFDLENNEILDFGSVQHASATEILRSAAERPIIRALSALGPNYLIELVRQVAPEVAFRDRYSSVCEICRSIVCSPDALRVLREHESLYMPAVRVVEQRREAMVA